MTNKTLEALMNQGFRKAMIEDRHVLIKEYTARHIPMIEVYELAKDGVSWEMGYLGHKDYIESQITKMEDDER